MPQTLKRKKLYDIQKSWEENITCGPQFEGAPPERKWLPESAWKTFLGQKVASTIGVPAGPLLNSQWIVLAAKLGFDILTYKTIRSRRSAAHPLPNILYVDAPPSITEGEVGGELFAGNTQRGETLAISNSFGNPSMEPEYLAMDIHLARHSLSKGQMLIVSVFGVGENLEEVTRDFCRAAAVAKEAGAQAIEANFSCPNVSCGGALYRDERSAYTIAKALVAEVAPLPVVIKMGVFPSQDSMERLFLALARAGVQGAAGINTIPMKLVDSEGKPALGPKRLQSGVCGDPIRSQALRFTEQARSICIKHTLDLEILSCGGITSPEHFTQFFAAGADAALSATGMMWDPELAIKVHNDHR